MMAFMLYPLDFKPLLGTVRGDMNRSCGLRINETFKYEGVERVEFGDRTVGLIHALMLIALNVPALSIDYFLCERNEMCADAGTSQLSFRRGQEHCPPCFRRQEIGRSSRYVSKPRVSCTSPQRPTAN
jgi:hypothetical protein